MKEVNNLENTKERVLFATGNEAKVKRFYDSLLKNNIELISLKDLDFEIEVEENGKDAIENALIKARAYYNKIKIPTMAMDDNLYIENIPNEKQPGMFVRRVNGKRLTDEEMIEYYSNLAKEYGQDGKLIAKWVYGLAIIINGKEKTYTWSKEDFNIVSDASKIVNSGYPLNSISKNIKLNKYFSEMTKEDWNNVKDNEEHVIEFIKESLKI